MRFLTKADYTYLKRDKKILYKNGIRRIKV